MTDPHPITPPPELINEWVREANHNEALFPQVAILAARWGADQQLEVCVDWLGDAPVVWSPNELVHPGTYLLEACRPKPPSLKERALKALQFVDEKLDLPLHNHCNAIHTIRTALEALPND